MCGIVRRPSFFFFFNDTATTEIYTLSLHDALPICFLSLLLHPTVVPRPCSSISKTALCLHTPVKPTLHLTGDRKSTRLNSSHANISYAVFCLKKKKPLCTSSIVMPPLLSAGE